MGTKACAGAAAAAPAPYKDCTVGHIASADTDAAAGEDRRAAAGQGGKRRD